MEKYFKYFVVLLVLYLVVQTRITENRIEKQKGVIVDLITQIKDVQRAIAVKDQPYIPDSISFFGGNVPLQYYGVSDDIDFWIRYYIAPKNRWRIILYLERKEEFFPKMHFTFKKFDVPLDAGYVSVAESELNTTVVSRAGAKGGWQFMLGTGRRNNLTINGVIDERLHFEKATVAACDELKTLQNEFKEFGLFESWMYALAGYNAGSGRVRQAIKKDNEKSYFLLVSLPKETEQYIPRIIALKLILENPERYGFVKGMKFGGPKIKLVDYSVKKFEPWSQLAKKFGISAKEIQRANAHILSKEGIPKGVYTLRIPERNK
ncbi:MAG: putative membrane-bound lytic murein transglycosylase [Parcubacteria group bacterium LiPW_41]|nr:MAG: putative membrane-bound lytic murein transglycosylase [Parcubacteria group bacterium LiPW_41]